MSHSRRHDTRCRTILLIGLSLSIASGCCCGLKRRGPFDSEVVAARELSRLGLEAMHRDSLPEAYARFAAALKSNPDDVETQRNLAKVLWQRGHAERAIEEMEEAIRRTGGKPEWTVELGAMFLAQSEFEASLECAGRALDECPTQSSAWRLQADVFQATGRIDEALPAYHQAVANGDESAEVLMQIAEIYRRKGRARRALSTLQRLEDQLPTEQHPQQLGQWQGLALQSMGRHEDALERFAVARQQLGDDPILLASIAASQSELSGNSLGNPHRPAMLAALPKTGSGFEGDAKLVSGLSSPGDQPVAPALHTESMQPHVP